MDSFAEELDHLGFARPLQFVLFFMLDLMLERVPQISQRLIRHPFRRESVIERRQNALLDFMQRHLVWPLSGQLRNRKIGWKFHLDRAGLVRLLPKQLLDKSGQEIIRCETQPKLLTAL